MYVEALVTPVAVKTKSHHLLSNPSHPLDSSCLLLEDNSTRYTGVIR